jgi:hypothetical protein
MRIHIVMRDGKPVEAWTDLLYAMRRSAEVGTGQPVVTLELRSENTPESAERNADEDRKSRTRPAK